MTKLKLGPLTRGSLLVVLFIALVGCATEIEQTADLLQDTASSVSDYVPPAVGPESRDLTQSDIERLMDELSNWGRWGSDDQLGAANLITPAKRLEAIALATDGITVSLAHRLLDEEAAIPSATVNITAGAGSRSQPIIPMKP